MRGNVKGERWGCGFEERVHMGEILKQRKVEFRLGSTEYFCRDQEYDAHT